MLDKSTAGIDWNTADKAAIIAKLATGKAALGNALQIDLGIANVLHQFETLLANHETDPSQPSYDALIRNNLVSQLEANYLGGTTIVRGVYNRIVLIIKRLESFTPRMPEVTDLIMRLKDMIHVKDATTGAFVPKTLVGGAKKRSKSKKSGKRSASKGKKASSKKSSPKATSASGGAVKRSTGTNKSKKRSSSKGKKAAGKPKKAKKRSSSKSKKASSKK